MTHTVALPCLPGDILYAIANDDCGKPYIKEWRCTDITLSKTFEDLEIEFWVNDVAGRRDLYCEEDFDESIFASIMEARQYMEADT